MTRLTYKVEKSRKMLTVGGGGDGGGGLGVTCAKAIARIKSQKSSAFLQI